MYKNAQRISVVDILDLEVAARDGVIVPLAVQWPAARLHLADAVQARLPACNIMMLHCYWNMMRN